MVVCPCCHSEITKFALVPFLLVLAIYLAIAPSYAAVHTFYPLLLLR